MHRALQDIPYSCTAKFLLPRQALVLKSCFTKKRLLVLKLLKSCPHLRKLEVGKGHPRVGLQKPLLLLCLRSGRLPQSHPDVWNLAFLGSSILPTKAGMLVSSAGTAKKSTQTLAGSVSSPVSQLISRPHLGMMRNHTPQGKVRLPSWSASWSFVPKEMPKWICYVGLGRRKPIWTHFWPRRKLLLAHLTAAILQQIGFIKF